MKDLSTRISALYVQSLKSARLNFAVLVKPIVLRRNTCLLSLWTVVLTAK